MSEPALGPSLAAPGLALLGLLACLPAPAQEPPDAWVRQAGGPLYFAVRVADVDRAADWYKTVFGLEQLGERADGDGWSILNLHSERLLVELIRDDRAQPVERARGLFKVGLRVPDVAAVADRAAAATGERPRVLEVERHGIRIVQLRDPEGNVIQLSSPLEPRR